MKKGATHVDWAISMGIFLVYVLLMFIFLKPGSQPTYSGNTLLDTVYSGLKEDTTYTVQRGYLIITPTASISPNTDYKIRIKDVHKYLTWDVSSDLVLQHLTMFNESLGKVPSNDLDGQDVAFDFKNEYCDPSCSHADKEVLDMITRLKNNEPNIFWFVYSEGATHSHLPADIGYTDVQCQEKDNCLLNDGDDPLSKVDNFTYEFGVIETYTGFSQAKLYDLNISYPESTTREPSTGYEALKTIWSFPEDKNFKINITNVEGYDMGYNQALNQEPGINIYAREEKVWFLDPKGYLIPAKITITVW